MFSVFSATLIRDLRLSFAQMQDALNPLVFFVIVIALFPLGVTPESELLQRIAPGIIWVAALLSVLLSLDKLFRHDYDDGSLEQMMLSSQPFVMIVMAKIIAHWMVTGLPLALISPLLGYFMQLEGDAVYTLWLSLMLGTPILNLLGAIGVGLTVAVNKGGVLLSLLILPLYIPILIFGASAVDFASTGVEAAGQLSFLTAMLLFSLSLAPLATAGALRITATR